MGSAYAEELREEQDAYAKHRDALLKSHSGMFALFVNKRFCGTFPTREAALERGYPLAEVEKRCMVFVTRIGAEEDDIVKADDVLVERTDRSSKWDTGRGASSDCGYRPLSARRSRTFLLISAKNFFAASG